MDTPMPMSAEERDLLELQTDLLRQAQDAARSGNDLQQLMMPIILEEAGYRAVRADADVVNPQYESLKKKNEKLTAQMNKNIQFLAKDESGNFRLSKTGRGDLNADRRARNEKLIAELNTVRKQLRTTDRYTQRAGDITSLERIENPATDLREENEQLLLERQNTALRGELPVSPALLSELDAQEEELHASLLENLGEGYETSTPGIEALAKFGEHRNVVLEAARRDDIATAGTAANQMGGFIDSLAASRTGRAMGATQTPFLGASNLMQIAQGYSGVGQQYYSNRALDFQMDQANNSPNLLESLAYQGAGTASTFGLAKLFFPKE
jgi:hypothetical protein